jgi:hypothetical protein
MEEVTNCFYRLQLVVEVWFEVEFHALAQAPLPMDTISVASRKWGSWS